MEHIESDKIVKIGIVVDDIEAAAEHYGKLFKLDGPLEVHVPDPNKVPHPLAYKKLEGAEVDPKLKWCKVELDPIYLEVVQPYDDTPSPWLNYLKKFGPGVCFISFFIDGFEQHIDFMEKGGFPMTFVEEKGFERYAYFNTQDKLGVTIELKERKPLPEV